MTIRDLTTKVANNGANVNGKLTAEEYNVLITQVKNMSNGAVYMGIATPTTAPQTYDGNVDLVYIASQSGKYANFGNIVVNDGEICALHWQHSTGWSKEVIPTLLSTKVDKVEGKGLSTNDYTNEDKAEVAKIAGKQDTLTLTVKDNGNIVLGNIAGQIKEFMPATPSGDPMHYAYIAAGATWSSSTGYWSLNGLKDITNEEMRKIHNFGFIIDLSKHVFMGKMAKIRTNYLRVGSPNYNGTSTPIENLAYGNTTIEVITLRETTGVYESNISAQNFDNAFYGCTKLREIHGRLQTSAIMTNTFSGCESLQRVRVWNLVANVSFKDCPNIDKDSILYAINNSAATSAITIRLHPTAYAKYSADSDIQAALAAKPLVTLISV